MVRCEEVGRDPDYYSRSNYPRKWESEVQPQQVTFHHHPLTSNPTYTQVSQKGVEEGTVRSHSTVTKRWFSVLGIVSGKMHVEDTKSGYKIIDGREQREVWIFTGKTIHIEALWRDRTTPTVKFRTGMRTFIVENFERRFTDRNRLCLGRTTRP